jgi:hypothetical protein
MKVFEVHADPAGEFKNHRSQYHQLVLDDRAFESRDAFLKYLSSTACAFLGEQKENWSPPVMQLF